MMSFSLLKVKSYPQYPQKEQQMTMIGACSILFSPGMFEIGTERASNIPRFWWSGLDFGLEKGFDMNRESQLML